jgi:hypothetical protein
LMSSNASVNLEISERQSAAVATPSRRDPCKE